MSWFDHDFATGEVVTETTMDGIRDNFRAIGGAWTSYTPTLVQGVTVTKTVTYAKYVQAGKFVWFQVTLAVTSAGTSGSAIRVGLPVTAAATSIGIGSGIVNDASVPETYQGTVLVTPGVATTCEIYRGATGTIAPVGTNPTFALASGDAVRISGWYEAA